MNVNLLDHELASLFPLMSGKDLLVLAADISENGQKEPIMVYEGKILDGRNRYRAVMGLGYEPVCIAYEGVNPLADIISWNLHRRHLTASQRATIAVDLLPRLEEDAKKMQGNRTDLKKENISPELDKGRASDIAGKALNVGRQYVSDAKRLKRDSPKLFESVRQGAVSLQEAKRQHQAEKKERRITEGAAKPMSEEEALIMKAFDDGETVVININSHFAVLQVAREQGRYVRVDRFSDWGNPFIVGQDGDRDECCGAYSDHYFPFKRSFHNKRRDLKGKALGCHCHPKRCHAHYLKRWADEETH